MPPNILGSFANDLQVADHCVLRPGIKQKSRMIQAVGIGTDSFGCLDNVPEVVLQA